MTTDQRHLAFFSALAGLLLFPGMLIAADQAVSGNLTVTGTVDIVGNTSVQADLDVAGNLEVYGSAVTLGTNSGSYGLGAFFDPTGPNAARWRITRLSAWLWEVENAGVVTPSMRLDSTNNLVLYSGGTAALTLNPGAKSLSLGAATLTANGTGLTTNGALTVGGTITAPSLTSGTGTLTLPTSTDTLVGRATADTLTNKTISGANNTITNVSLSSGVTGTLPIANGGTGATTAAAARINLGVLFGGERKTVTSGYQITAADAGKCIVLPGSYPSPSVSLPAPGEVPAGFTVAVQNTQNDSNKLLSVNGAPGGEGKLGGKQMAIYVSDGNAYFPFQFFQDAYDSPNPAPMFDSNSGGLLLWDGASGVFSGLRYNDGSLSIHPNYPSSPDNPLISGIEMGFDSFGGGIWSLPYDGVFRSVMMPKVTGTMAVLARSGDNAGNSVSATTGTVNTTLIAGVLPFTPTGNMTLNIVAATAGQTPYIGAQAQVIITTSGTASRTITFGTSFKSTGPLATGTVSGKVFTVSFVYDGTNWCETGRTTDNAQIAGVVSVLGTTSSTSTTTGALTVAGGVGLAGNLNVGGAASATSYTSTSGTITGGTTGLTLNAGGAGNQNITLAPTGTGNVLLNSNVGIGTTTPNSAIEISGNNKAIRMSALADPGYRLTLENNYSWANPMNLKGFNDTVIIGIYSGNTALMTGNVGIGNATPSSKLDVRATGQIYGLNIQASDGYHLKFSDPSNGQHGTLSAAFSRLNFNGFTNGVIFNTGNVGIGTTTPTAKLDIAGTVKVTGAARFDGPVHIAKQGDLEMGEFATEPQQ